MTLMAYDDKASMAYRRMKIWQAQYGMGYRHHRVSGNKRKRVSRMS